MSVNANTGREYTDTDKYRAAAAHLEHLIEQAAAPLPWENEGSTVYDTNGEPVTHGVEGNVIADDPTAELIAAAVSIMQEVAHVLSACGSRGVLNMDAYTKDLAAAVLDR